MCGKCPEPTDPRRLAMRRKYERRCPTCRHLLRYPLGRVAHPAKVCFAGHLVWA